MAEKTEKRTAEVVLTAETEQFTKEIDKGNKSLDKLLKTLDKTSKAWDGLVKKTGKSLIKIGTAELAGYTALSVIAGKLEKQTENIEANMAINNQSSQFGMVTDSIREMSRAMPVARSEIALMATAVSDLGFTTGKQIGQVTNQFTKMGLATGENSQALATNMVQFQRSMGKEPTSQSMEPYSNSATYLSARAGAPAASILGFAQNLAPAARVAGLAQSSVLGLSTAAVRSGADGIYASNTLNSILNDVTALRYTGSPEISRYSNALGIPLEELTRKTKGPEDQDRFMRDIMGQVIASSQSAEGPTKLGMLGFDGLRAKKALQALSSESGGIDRWIDEARYGMTSGAVETGYEKASEGMFDQATVLRNNMTDFGQTVGEPLAKGITGLLTVVNKTAQGFQPLTSAVAKVTSIFAGPLGVALIGFGAALKTWSLLASGALAKRLVNNVGTQALGRGANRLKENFQIGRMAGREAALGKLKPGEFKGAAPTQPLSRLSYYMGGGYGGILPNMRPGSADPTKGPIRNLGQRLLGGADRAAAMLRREAIFNYAQAYRKPDERVAASKEYRDSGKDKYQRERTGPYRIRDPLITAGKGLTHVPLAGAKWGVMEAGRLGLRAHQALPGALGRGAVGLGRGAVGLGMAGMSAMFANPMMAALPLGLLGMSVMGDQKTYRDRWKDGGTGLDGIQLDNLTAYNEQLGIATRSLVRFSHEMDKTNPAKTEDVISEVLNSKNVEKVGTSPGYEMTNEGVKKYDTADKAKAWLSAQGNLNADQSVLAFRDLASNLSSDDYNETLTWFTRNQGRSSYGTSTNIDLLGQTYADEVGKSMGWTDYVNPFATSKIANKNSQNAGDLGGAIASKATAYGENLDASSLIPNAPNDRVAQEALSYGAEVGMVTEQLVRLLDDVGNSKGYWNINRSKGAYLEFAEVSSAQLGNLDLGEVTNDEYLDSVGALSPEKRAAKIRELMYKEVADKRGSSEEGEALLGSDLFTQDSMFGGKRVEEYLENLPDLKILTSVDQILNNSDLKDLSSTQKNAFSSGTLLEKAATTGLYDQMDQMMASQDLLNVITDGFTTTADDTATSIQKMDAALRSMKSGLSEQSPIWNVVTGAQGLVGLQGSYMDFASLGQKSRYDAKMDQNLIDSASVVGVNRNPEAGADLGTRKGEIIQQRKDEYAQLRELDRDRFREQQDWDQQREYSDWSFYRSRRFAQDDFQRQTTRSREAYQRQYKNSEAGFQRSLEYQQQDFYRSRRREQKSHDRQMQYAAEDAAKAIGDPYNRLQLQILADPSSMQHTMENRLGIVAAQNKNIDTLRSRGLSEEAVQQLDLTNFGNAQQTQHLANTMTDPEIAEFNKIAKAMVSQSGDLNKENAGTKRQEEERQIGLSQGMKDWLRQLSRTKLEHSISVNFSKKEFEIGIAQAGEELSISLRRAEEEYQKGIQESEKTRQRSFDRAIENIYGIYRSNIKGESKMAEETYRLLEEYGGRHTDALVKRYARVGRTLAKIQAAIDKIEEGIDWGEVQENYDEGRRRATAAGASSVDSPSRPHQAQGGRGGGAAVARARNVNSTADTGMCLSHVSSWLGVKGIRSMADANEAWDNSVQKHYGDKNAPAGKPVYWSGGKHGHVALSLGKEYIRSTDWPSAGKVGTTTIDNLSKSWGRSYRGWAGDAWGIKLADGGVAKATPGGVKATVAEAGSNELVMPLNNRGLSFMKDFQVNLAHELVRSMPKTPVSSGVTNNITNRNQNIDIDTVEVSTNDPKDFAKKLKVEAQKKRAALYKA